ncbi:PIN domain-containing protein [Patulibacter defluvii]|uniref:PIN domain-containing protein n=1 Tax=Patulibacter defluvii TaxID=3095358 RepID=UPI002A761F00|nr:PIN domain-containing protein [Patulibacter sp. DM4]
MTIVLDTSFFVALTDRRDDAHAEVAAYFQATDEDFVTTPLALAEMDHFAARVGGPDGQQLVWDDFDAGVYGLRWWADGLRDTIAVARGRPEIGLTDASLVALAARLHTTRIATLDLQHFRAVTDRNGQPFTLLPADA